MAGVSNLLKVLKPLKNRVMGMVARALIESMSDDSIPLARVTLSKDETRDGLEVLQQYGISSRPGDGSEAVVVFVGGNRDDGLVIATANGQAAFKVSEWDTALYTRGGNFIHLKDGDNIEIYTDKDLIINGKNVTVTCDKLDVNNENLTVE